MGDVARKLAEHEVGWWKDHHRKNKAGLMENMARLYELQFGMPYQEAVECVKYRVSAAKEHDEAERLEDMGRQAEADVYWKKAEDLIEKHFEMLLKYQAKK